MKQFILVNAILEMVVGATLLFLPTFAPGVSDTDAVGVTFVRMYGAAALAIGFLALQIWQNIGNTALVQVLLKSLVAFHVCVGIANILGYNAGYEDALGVAGLHGLLSIGVLYFMFKK
jgi:hypothetical protein